MKVQVREVSAKFVARYDDHILLDRLIRKRGRMIVPDQRDVMPPCITFNILPSSNIILLATHDTSVVSVSSRATIERKDDEPCRYESCHVEANHVVPRGTMSR